MRGWVYEPVHTKPEVLLYCLPGGRCSTAYFDLQVRGHDGYSMADYMTARGFAVASIDHPGIGESDPVDDLTGLTPGAVAAAHHRALSDVVAGLDWAPRLTVGVGHSMGGMLVGVQQGRHRSFDAIAVLGHGGDGLPGQLSEDEVGAADEDRIVELARKRERRAAAPGRRLPPGSFFGADVPRAARDAFIAAQVELLPACGLASMIPGATDMDKESIDVPLFAAFGTQDLCQDFRPAIERYPAVTDATLFVLPGSGHCHNQASNRFSLWDRLVRWVLEIRAVAGAQSPQTRAALP